MFSDDIFSSSTFCFSVFLHHQLTTPDAVQAGKAQFRKQQGGTNKKKEPLVEQALVLWESLNGGVAWEDVEQTIKTYQAFEDPGGAPAHLIQFICAQRRISDGEKVLSNLLTQKKREVNSGKHPCHRRAGQSKDHTVKKSTHASLIWTLLRHGLSEVVQRMEGQHPAQAMNTEEDDDVKDEPATTADGSTESAPLDLGVELLKVHNLVIRHLTTTGTCTSCPVGWHKENVMRTTKALSDPLHCAMVSIEILELMINICKGNGYLPGVGLVHQTAAEASFSGLQNLTPLLGVLSWTGWRTAGALNVINHSAALLRRLAVHDVYGARVQANGYNVNHDAHALLYADIGIPMTPALIKVRRKQTLKKDGAAAKRRTASAKEKRKSNRNKKFTSDRAERSKSAQASIEAEVLILQQMIVAGTRSSLFQKVDLEYGESNLALKAATEKSVQQCSMQLLSAVLSKAQAKKVSNRSKPTTDRSKRPIRAEFYTLAYQYINAGAQENEQDSCYNAGDGICTLRAALYLVYGKKGQKNSMLAAALEDLLKAAVNKRFISSHTTYKDAYQHLGCYKHAGFIEKQLQIEIVDVARAWQIGKTEGRVAIGLAGHIGARNHNGYKLSKVWVRASNNIKPWFGSALFDILINWRIKQDHVAPECLAPMLVADLWTYDKMEDVTKTTSVLYLFLVTRQKDGGHIMSQWHGISMEHALYLCVQATNVPPRIARFVRGTHYDVNVVKKAQWKHVSKAFKNITPPADLPIPHLTEPVVFQTKGVKRKKSSSSSSGGDGKKKSKKYSSSSSGGDGKKKSKKCSGGGSKKKSKKFM